MYQDQAESAHSTPQSGSSRVHLTRALYDELRRLAAARMAMEQGPQTLQATALLHEAWLRLGGDDQPNWESEEHFYSAVASAMRHILVDRARRRQCFRHGGGMERIDGDQFGWDKLDCRKTNDADQVILAMNAVLEELSRGDPDTGKLIKLHYFVGLSVADLAKCLKLSERTVARRLAFARSLLGERMRRELNLDG